MLTALCAVTIARCRMIRGYVDSRKEVVAMPNTMFFIQCAECEHCCTDTFTWFCAKTDQYIDNPEVDGCTFGSKREESNAWKMCMLRCDHPGRAAVLSHVHGLCQ